MADTAIEWAEKVWNPLVGCTYASPGCTNCYAVDQAWIRSHNPAPAIRAKFAGTVAKSEKGHRHWTGQINFDEAALLAPLRWKKPARIFVNSMSDLFHEAVTDEQIDRVFAVMALCPHHTFQVLTKRADRMRGYLARLTNEGGTRWAADILSDAAYDFVGEDGAIALANVLNGFSWWRSMPPRDGTRLDGSSVLWPLPNVWLGVSVENQQAADERIPHLLATPAALRWISAEPLLGPVDLRSSLYTGEGGITMRGYLRDKDEPDDFHYWASKLDWVVCGGESGKDARPMHPDWARSLRDQCAAAGVPFFFKQWGEWRPDTLDDPVTFDTGKGRAQRYPAFLIKQDGTVHCFIPETELMAPVIIRVGKKRAGRLLDGTLHDAFPILPATGRGTGAAGGGAPAA